MGMNRMKINLSVIVTAVTLSFMVNAQAQPLSNKYASMLTLPRAYVCHRVADTIHIDGIGNETSWQHAVSTDAFVDISGYDFPTPQYRTSVKMLWDDNYLYFFAELEEPHIWANLHERDAVVYYDNDFEVFIDPQGDGHNYFEIETNARGTIFDLSLSKPYRAKPNPFVQFQWNCPGLKLAVHCNGTINNPNDSDIGWNVEMAIPHEAIANGFHNYLQAGTWLRTNFSRVQWQYDIDGNGKYSRKKDGKGNFLPEDNWVWSPIGKIAMHMLERWGYVYLSGKKAGTEIEEIRYPKSQAITNFLWMLFYAQEEQKSKHKSYFKTLADFNLYPEDLALIPEGYRIFVETTAYTYEIRAVSSDGSQYVIDESGRCFMR